MNLILCGLPMCGKTTIGKKLAAKLNRQLLESDRMIEIKENMPCREIVQKNGNLYFRQIENEQIASLVGKKNCIISLGGGSLEHSKNREIIASLGALIYLKAPVHLLWERTKERGVPAFLDQNHPELSFYEMAARRICHYEQMSGMIIDTINFSDEDILERIIEWQAIHLEPFSK